MEGKRCVKDTSARTKAPSTRIRVFLKKKEKKDALWSKMAKSKRHKATFN